MGEPGKKGRSVLLAIQFEVVSLKLKSHVFC